MNNLSSVSVTYFKNRNWGQGFYIDLIALLGSGQVR